MHLHFRGPLKEILSVAPTNKLCILKGNKSYSTVVLKNNFSVWYGDQYLQEFLPGKDFMLGLTSMTFLGGGFGKEDSLQQMASTHISKYICNFHAWHKSYTFGATHSSSLHSRHVRQACYTYTPVRTWYSNSELLTFKYCKQYLCIKE